MRSKLDYLMNFPADFLIEQYSTKAFYEARMKMDGIEDADIVLFESDGNKTRYCIERHVEMQTDRAPKFIQKIADNLVKGAVTVRTQGEWDKKKLTGINQIHADGMPVNVNIDFKFIPEGDSSTRIKAEMEIKARIPIVGKQLEKFMMPKMERVMVKDFDKVSEYFKSL